MGCAPEVADLSVEVRGRTRSSCWPPGPDIADAGAVPAGPGRPGLDARPTSRSPAPTWTRAMRCAGSAPPGDRAGRRRGHRRRSQRPRDAGVRRRRRRPRERPSRGAGHRGPDHGQQRRGRRRRRRSPGWCPDPPERHPTSRPTVPAPAAGLVRAAVSEDPVELRDGRRRWPRAASRLRNRLDPSRNHWVRTGEIIIPATTPAAGAPVGLSVLPTTRMSPHPPPHPTAGDSV